MSRSRILIVDDEPNARFGMRTWLEARGFDVDEAGDCASAVTGARTSRPDVAVLDYLLPDGNALTLMTALRDVEPGLPVVILTGHGSIDLAVRAIKEGAEHFLTKPVEMASLGVILERVIEYRRTRQKQLAGTTVQAREVVDPFLGTSPAIRALRDEATRVAVTESPILIEGETGAGKGVLAQWLHRNGPRSEEAFVDVNCAGLSRELLESELFGHERGAFTGAVSTKPGLLEVANRGTVFLDEVGDMDLQIQARLLKVLEEKRFRRVGDVRDRRVDIRLVAATHRDLRRLVQDNSFRADLFYRISAIPLRVPSLSQRGPDIPLLATQLLERVGASLGRPHLRLAPAALETLGAHSWPGNIRELRNVVERAALLADHDLLEPRDLRFQGPLDAAPGAPADADLTLEEVERRHIERVLEAEGGKVGAAARRLGVPRSSLYQKIKAYGLPTSRG